MLKFRYLIVWGFLVYGCGANSDPDRLRTEAYTPVIERVSSVITAQMQDKNLPAVSIALVDGGQTVWAEGFGFADPAAKKPATARTVYRIGSVSKLFTDIAIMQLVERGQLDLDVPVRTYLPGFRPRNPFGKPITLRQLMSHRAGLVREPPVGNYFDPTAPSLARTVASLNTTALVYPPETRTKYSNAGISVCGYVLEKQQKTPFSVYLRKAVLAPMGLQSSAFEPLPRLQKQLAKAVMWSYDGRAFPAPTFELGMAPAGSMYSTVLDLARFMRVLFRGGSAPGGRILQPATLEKMWQPQFAPPGATTGYGIGFSVSELDGYRRIGHGGAIYGFATQLYALPEERIGVVVVTNVDVANAVMRFVADFALRTLRAHRENRPLPSFTPPQVIDPARAKQLEGTYRSGDETRELVERDGRLYAWIGSSRYRMKARGDTLVTDDRLGLGSWLLPEPDGLRDAAGRTFKRIKPGKPAPAPARWRDLIGEYGWDHNTLFILEKAGQLHALIEWCFLYPLEEIGPDMFAFPDYGLYHGERLEFIRSSAGKITRVIAANVDFPRRKIGTAAGQTFRIKPQRPIDALRSAARQASPPLQADTLLQPDLVDLATLDPTLRFDIRYATTNNFMSAVFYDEPRAFMQRPAAEALVRVHRSLLRRGYGLLIHDAYRPWYVTKMFWDATPDSLKDFVADPATGSIHNRGAAVDLTLYSLRTGRPVQMTGGYDEFSARSYPDYQGGTALQRWHRELLRDAMEAQGFSVYRFEWWHFNDKDAARYPVLNLTFAELDKQPRREH